MGNKNSICPSERFDDFFDCPICLDTHSEHISLKCGHKFDYYCIQMHIYTRYSNRLNICCPYCRTLICKKTLQKIWKKWIIINYKSDLFNNITILNIDNKLKITNINPIKYNTDINTGTIFMPLFYDKPVFLSSPIINDSAVLYNDKVTKVSNILSSHKSIYNENLNNYKFIMDCYITDKNWQKFLIRVNKFFAINLDDKLDYCEKIKYSEYKIRLYISDIKNVKTVDNYYGRYDNKLHYFKNRKFRCIFKMFFIRNESDFFLVNELQSIVYN
jgi:hypothetical protein